MSFRCERTEENIRRQVSLVIRNLKNMSLASKQISVVCVKVSKDCSFARIYISSIKGIVYAKQAIGLLNRVSGFIRHEISRSLKLKKVPKMEFLADDYIKYSEHMEDLFLKIKG